MKHNVLFWHIVLAIIVILALGLIIGFIFTAFLTSFTPGWSNYHELAW